MLNKEDILNFTNPSVIRVDIPEMNNHVFVRAMTVGELDLFSNEVAKENGVLPRTLLASICTCDDEGNRLFTEDDVKKLSQSSGIVVNRIFEAAMKINDLSNNEDTMGN